MYTAENHVRNVIYMRMDRLPEMTDISHPVQLFSNDREARSLLEVETSGRHQVTSGEEVRHSRTDLIVGLLEHLLDVPL